MLERARTNIFKDVGIGTCSLYKLQHNFSLTLKLSRFRKQQKYQISGAGHQAQVMVTASSSLNHLFLMAWWMVSGLGLGQDMDLDLRLGLRTGPYLPSSASIYFLMLPLPNFLWFFLYMTKKFTRKISPRMCNLSLVTFWSNLPYGDDGLWALVRLGGANWKRHPNKPQRIPSYLGNR